MNIIQAIEQYQEFSELVKAPNTVKYQRFQAIALSKFFREKKITDTTQIIDQTIDALVRWSKKTCRNITINKRMQYLKQVYRHFKINFPYLLEYKKLRQDLLIYDIVHEDELERIMTYQDAMDEENPYYLTRKVIILLFLDSGIRQSEMFNLEIPWINFAENSIKLEMTKTRTERIVFFSKLTRAVLLKYIAMDPKRKHLLWNYRSYKPFTYRNLEVMFRRIKLDLQIPKLHARMLRHTFATILVENGCRLSTVQQLVGHASLETTQIYMHMSVKVAKKDFDNFGYLSQKSNKKLPE